MRSSFVISILVYSYSWFHRFQFSVPSS